MKAIVCTKYGPPEVLQLKEVEKPIPEDNQVRIKIYAATVNATDPIFRTGKPFISRFFTGLRKPKNPIPGTEFAGVIETVGKGVKRFKVGDQVFGQTGLSYGAYAEYLCMAEDGALAIKPTNMDYGEAAAVCDGALGALAFLRKGNMGSGQEILINGASGSVGTFGVQIAKHFGAQVTGVCSTTNVELVKSLGADKVIDYTREDFTKAGETYDFIFDVVGKSSFSRSKGALKQGGVYISTVLTKMTFPLLLWTSLVGSKKVMMTAPAMRPPGDRAQDLVFLKELIEAGKMRSVMDRRYSMEQIVEAHIYVEAGHKKGNVVLTMEHDDKTE